MPLIQTYRPKMILTELDAAGDPVVDGDVDVSCDIQRAELTPNIPTTDVETWCGTFTVVGELTEACTITFAIRSETEADWSPLVGKNVAVQVWDREDSTRHRTFTSTVRTDPSLYGSNQSGQPRNPQMALPVLDRVAWADGGYVAP